MELLGPTSYMCFAVALFVLFAPLRISFMLLVMTAPLTTVATIDDGGSSVLIYHLVWLAFTVRFVMREAGERTRSDVPSAEAGLSQVAAAYLVVVIAIMLVSVPELYFLSFWVVLGLARHLVDQAEQEEGACLRERGARRARRRVLSAEGQAA